MIPIGRRDFIAGLGAAAWPVAALAQQRDRVRRVGVLMSGAETDTQYQPFFAAFVLGLRQLGWTEGKNLRLDVRWSGSDPVLPRTYAAQLIGLMPDVILVYTETNLLAVRETTSTVPVVFAAVLDPVAQGFVASVRRPGGNVTGFSLLGPSLGGKWVDLLKKVDPGLARVAVMFNPDTSPQSELLFQAAEAAGRSLGVQAVAVPVRTAVEIETALADFGRQPGGGLMLPGDSFTGSRFALIADLAGRYRLPSISWTSNFTNVGGLMAYGSPDSTNTMRQAAGYVDRILKGEKPGDLPVQAPTHTAFIINLKTAQALGLEIPPGVLAIVDGVIE